MAFRLIFGMRMKREENVFETFFWDRLFIKWARRAYPWVSKRKEGRKKESFLHPTFWHKRIDPPKGVSPLVATLLCPRRN